MRISILDQVGHLCLTHLNGQRIYELILGPLLAGRTVTLDFTSVTHCAAPFFNCAIGQLFKEVAEQKVRENLLIENLNTTGKMIVERVKENASRYYADPNYRKIVDDVLELQSKELA